jgi:hypothetical protein
MLIAGIPMALIGLGSTIFGGGGIGSILMSILGVGSAAAGAGLFSGAQGGAVCRFGQSMGTDQVGQFINKQTGTDVFGGGQPASPQAAPQAAATQAGGFKVPSLFWKGNPQEQQEVLAAIQQHSPETMGQLDEGIKAYDSPMAQAGRWVGIDPSVEKAQQMGMSPEQFQQLMERRRAMTATP